jgi:anthranilate synthase component 1
VHVDPYRAIERYSHVMHIVSGVQRRARAGPRRLRPVRRHVPGRHAGRRAEGARDADHRRARAGARGLYGGTVGYFGARGDMDQAITIRTLVFRGDEYSYQAGAGIVADSVPQAEYEEVFAKSALGCARALAIAREGL